VAKIILSPKSGNGNFGNEMAKNGYPDVCGDWCLCNREALAALINNIEGSYHAVKRLIQLGHRAIAIITGPSSVTGSVDRMEGYRLALQEAGLILNQSLIKQKNSQVAGGFRATEELLVLPTPPTTIFVTNNRMTIGVMKALRAHHIRFPEEIAIIGFDDFECVICLASRGLRSASTINPSAPRPWLLG
jgi:LacI family transcriptional regulator